MPAKELHRRHKRINQLLVAGHTRAEVAEIVGVTLWTVWRASKLGREYREDLEARAEQAAIEQATVSPFQRLL